ncbi:MAG TPA: dodecin family protein [Nitrosomonas sp.]|nr:dodecin family protein [Nitrosomonas sp.]HQU98349.1 dodecin family protein [Nitrosomonas sp.]HQX13782.1 dodecin family protein [Nitrosomonas sp.]HRB33214.1 dodecin family protein [Nitrosomonas sp.]HRB45677.1 dodecin family protein [Nitrosomonas sp.]
MDDHVYKVIEVVGSSTVSSDDAIQQAIAKSAKSLRNLDWFEVVETRGHIVNAKVAHFQVKIKIGFRLD